MTIINNNPHFHNRLKELEERCILETLKLRDMNIAYEKLYYSSHDIEAIELAYEALNAQLMIQAPLSLKLKEMIDTMDANNN
jgi:hypothetical protein